MGKWKSNEEFLHSRNKFRMALNEELFSPSDSDVDVPPTTTIPTNDEFFLDEPHPDPQPVPEVEPIPENTPPAQIQTTQVIIITDINNNNTINKPSEFKSL